MNASAHKVSITRALIIGKANTGFVTYPSEEEQKADIAEAEKAYELAHQLIGGVKLLLQSAPVHMTHRNALEREAYRQITAAMEGLE